MELWSIVLSMASDATATAGAVIAFILYMWAKLMGWTKLTVAADAEPSDIKKNLHI